MWRPALTQETYLRKFPTRQHVHQLLFWFNKYTYDHLWLSNILPKDQKTLRMTT